MHEDLVVPLFADHIRALSESFDSKLADVGNPLVLQLGKLIPLLKFRCLLLSLAKRSNAGMANRQGDVDLRFAQVSAPPHLAL